MKKILFFAFVLVAGALAFTSCDKKDGNNPNDPLVGTWAQWDEASENIITFDGKGNYTYTKNYYFALESEVPHESFKVYGSYTIEGDLIYIHNTKQTISMDGETPEEWPGNEPEYETMKYRIENNTLHLTRHYDTPDYSWEEVFTKK